MFSLQINFLLNIGNLGSCSLTPFVYKNRQLHPSYEGVNSSMQHLPHEHWKPRKETVAKLLTPRIGALKWFSKEEINMNNGINS